mgnify:FL=1
MSLVPTPGATGGAEGLFLILFGGVLSQQTIGTLMIGWRFLDFYFLTVLALLILGADTLLHQILAQNRTSSLKTKFNERVQENLANMGFEPGDKSKPIQTEKGGISN